MNLIPDENRDQANKTAFLAQTQQNFSKPGIFFCQLCSVAILQNITNEHSPVSKSFSQQEC